MALGNQAKLNMLPRGLRSMAVRRLHSTWFNVTMGLLGHDAEYWNAIKTLAAARSKSILEQVEEIERMMFPRSFMESEEPVNGNDIDTYNDTPVDRSPEITPAKAA